jgi:glycosyltransferase involved in cell wall biosynthesis
MQTTPLISIIMPVYNGERFVRDAIDSVLRQSHQTWELTVVNDGSTDGTRKILGQFTDPRITIIDQSNQGVSAARNAGLARMKGAYFCFLDSDDVLPPDSLANRVKVFDRSGDISFVDGAVEIFNEDLSVKVSAWRPTFQGTPFQQLIQLTARCFFGPTWMVRVVPGMHYSFQQNVTHGEDLLFYLEISKNGGVYAFTDEVILYYRKNSGSAMTNLDGLARGYTVLRDRVKKLFGEKISFGTGIILSLKTRKIMFLSFLSAGKFGKAFQYLLLGRI